jgi:hypothetical protein
MRVVRDLRLSSMEPATVRREDGGRCRGKGPPGSEVISAFANAWRRTRGISLADRRPRWRPAHSVCFRAFRG